MLYNKLFYSLMIFQRLPQLSQKTFHPIPPILPQPQPTASDHQSPPAYHIPEDTSSTK